MCLRLFRLLGRFYIPQIRISIKGTLKLLGIDLTVLVKDVGVHFCNHINFSMARISLCGFQIAVVEFQLISNSVSFVDYRKYHSNKRSYHFIRRTSDRLCKEYGLSVIVPGQDKGKSYIEHTAEKAGTSYKAKLKAAIDRLIPQVSDFEELLKRLEVEGYEIKRGKYISCRPTGQERFTRLKTLGMDYTEEAVTSRIAGGPRPSKQPMLGDQKISLLIKHVSAYRENRPNDYDGVRHDYTRKKGLVWQDVFLPEFAPSEWKDRGVLWNAVEENEKTKDSRLAREFVPALPVELTPVQWQELLTDFIQSSFVAEGMCADVAIHDPHPPGHNPHAHIMLTVCPLDKQGNWQYKTEKEYLCVRNGEERGFTAAEFKAAQADGWEKQYPYKVGRKKVYMPPSEAEKHGYERANKHPKSTKFGRQNPIAERWNSEEQLVEWRKAWADVTNRYLEQYGHDERIDHRSHADRGLTEQPTIHEGVVARALEKKGIISDRCEINRQIKADNALLRELKATVKKLMQAVKNTVPAIAEAMEKIRSSMLIFSYQLRYIGIGKNSMGKRVKAVKPELERYAGLVNQIKAKLKERKNLLAEKKETPFYQIPKLHDLTHRITELTEEIEELKTEKDFLLRSLDCADDAGISDVKKEIATLESALKKLSEQAWMPPS